VEGGAVLVGECHIWAGPAKYVEKLNQLFGYLIFRHTEGVMITFSRTRGLTRLTAAAKKATEGDPSFAGTLTDVHSTHFTSRHRHPADDDKGLTLHHFLFDLAVE
jgi:hypothetical protein